MPAHPTPSIEGQLLEVFSSIQGEGIFVGCRQVFLRMAGCNLDCAYCDTPFVPQPDCRVEDAPGSRNFRSLPNPVSLELLYNILYHWSEGSPGVHHSISVTGGEPLVQAEVLLEWLPALRRIFPIYLETNGSLPEALEPLLSHLDFISMDLKLPSQTGLPPLWDEHRDFLTLARERSCQAKVVVGEDTPWEEIEEAANLLHTTAPEVPLIFQAVTRNGKVAVPGRVLLEMQTRAARIHPYTRVIPQMHRFLGLL
jgi:7-carboxy-7-deazaguanine synthase